MRKYIVLILFLLSLKLYSQIAIDVPQITRPSPSQNGIANFNEIQVNTFTGVPDISIPLMGLPTRAKEISVDLSLQYHPSGVSVYNGVSDVGMGWNLFGGGQITRKIIGKPDKYCSTGSQALCDNQGMYTDEYNYSFMGFGGRFKLVKNATTGVYEVQHMDLTPLKIEFEISSTDNTITSFTIYDTHGFQYVFGIKNRLQGSFNQGRNSISFEEYSDTYQITQVKDNNNNILLSFNYENFSFQGFSNSQYIDITYNKLKKIISPGFGSITFNFDFTTSYINGLNDPFQINGVLLKDSNETVIKNMVLEYNIVNYIAARRMLNKVTYWDNNNTNSKVYRLNYNSMLKPSFFCDEDYGFDYDNFGYISLKQIAGFMNETAGITIPEVVKSGVLNSIQLPTGGSIEYDFESNSYPFEFYSSNESNSTELRRNPYNIDFNNYATYYYLSSGSTTRELTVTGTETKELFFQFWDNPYTTELTPEPGTFFHPTYRLVGNGVNYSFSQNNTALSCLGSGLLLEPGTYTIQINALPGVIDGISGHIEIRERTLKPNLIVQQYGAGVRVKNIRYLDGNNGNTTREQHYNYNRFDAPTLSSGEIFQGDWEDDFIGRKIGAQVGYTNVTISNGEANGYTRHTYMSKDEPVNLDLPTNNFRNILCYQAGLLKKVAVYDATNRLLSVAENDYIFEHIGESFWIPSSNSLTYNYSTKLSWPKLNTRVSKSYTYTGSTANEIGLTEQFTYHSSNRQIDEHTISYSLGETKKTKYYYHSGNSIHSKNRISVLEKVENYRGSTLLSTSRINYATTFAGNASHLPQTIEVAKGNNSFEPKVRYQAYDTYGHPTQVSTENGLTTSYVWGYNKSMPIAVIENATNASIATALATSFDNINESHLTALTNLRTNAAFATARITTYTHKPLVGVLTVTDPRGDKINYDYDTFNRLKWVKDKNNYLLSETEYYYRQTSAEQNYVKTKNYKVPTTSSIATPSLTQALEGITYFDGLGRTIQQQAKGQSATGKDIITHFEYDELGRQSKQYLPFASGQTTMAYVFGETLKASIISQYQTLYGDSNPYSETRFETSPLSRVLEQAAPGNDWAMANAEKHTIRFDYQTNSDADQVKLFKAATNWDANKELYTISLVNSSGTVYHPANTLHKSVVKNENWKPGDGLANTTEEFKDKEGRVLMKRTYGISMVENVETTVWHETYNVYDEYGNLTYVIPPLADGAITEDVLNGLCYQYRYDAKNRLVEKKLPGKQWEFIVYDKLDRIVMTGPALSPFTSPTGNGWMITKYDVYNRPILTAWMSGTVTSDTRKTHQVARNAATVFHETKTTSNTTINGVGFRYTTTSLPTSGYHVLTVNYYDDYETGLTVTPAISYSDIHGQALLNNTAGNKPVGLPTVSWVRVPETTSLYKHEKSYTLYDKKGRTVRTFKNNYLTGYLQTDQKLQPITGRVDFTETRHKRLSANPELYVKDTFTYTDQDRLLSHTHQIGTAGTPQLLAKNEYDELGQLISKQVGGTDVTTFVGLQKVDYSYNIRGWLKSINDVDNLSQSGSPTDLFAFKLNYNEVENTTNYTGKALYNGNIAETYWRTNNDDVKRKYGYFYDDLNRLTSAVYQKPNLAVPVTNSYNESLTYDKNGNISTLLRNGEYDDASYALQVDDLRYNYHTTNKNQLIEVRDMTNNPNGFKDVLNEIDYSYDAFGNMESDANKGITRISYNHLNLPLKITFAGTKHIQYLYNATGQKVQKTVTDGSMVVITDYLDGFQYLKQGTENIRLHFFSHAEGYVNTIGGNNYVFNYTDHLGNVRVSYGKDPDTGLLAILEENNYYPFGLKQENYNITKQEYDKYGEDVGLVPCVNCAYKYKYNGKEFQDEFGLNMTAMDYRQYDNALGRFNSIDALSELMPDITGYHFGFNNPVYWGDPSGLKPSSNMSALQLANTAFSNTEEGTNSYWVNDGVGNFDYAGDGFGGGSSNLAGSFINSYGAFVSGFDSSTDFENGSYVVYNGNPDAGLLHTVVVQAYKSKGVGQPGSWESAIPVWGSGRAAYDHFQNGNYWRGIGYSALALSDLFLVKSAVTAIGKGIAVGVSKMAAKKAVVKGVTGPTGKFYSVAYETTLSSELFPGGSYYSHFKAANTSLSNAMASDAAFANSMSSLGITVPRSATGTIIGKSPANWVWHHDVGTGVMQLVPKAQHTSGSMFWDTMHPNGVGGMFIWNK